MKNIATFSLIALATFTSQITQGGVFTIAGFTFDEANSVTTATILDGGNLKTHSCKFAKYSEAYQRDAAVRTNDFSRFDRSNTIGRMLAQTSYGNKGDSSRHVLFPSATDAPPIPNVQRFTVELTWDGASLRNKPGNDFLIYEVGNWEGFAVSVLKSGSTEWTPYRYQFSNGFDATHDVNAVAFDLLNFLVAENETITAIRIRNLFNNRATEGADKVDNKSGQGTIIYPGGEIYKNSFPLLDKPNGKEFKVDTLDADIVYVVGLHNLETPTPNKK